MTVAEPEDGIAIKISLKIEIVTLLRAYYYTSMIARNVEMRDTSRNPSDLSKSTLSRFED